jgi:hypothetical protein
MSLELPPLDGVRTEGRLPAGPALTFKRVHAPYKPRSFHTQLPWLKSLVACGVVLLSTPADLACILDDIAELATRVWSNK